MRNLILAFFVLFSANLFAQKTSIGLLAGSSVANNFTKISSTSQFQNSFAFGLTFDYNFTDNLILSADIIIAKTLNNNYYNLYDIPNVIFLDDYYYYPQNPYNVYVPIKIGYRFNTLDCYVTPKIGLYSNFNFNDNYNNGKTAEIEIGKTIKNFNLFSSVSILSESEFTSQAYNSNSDDYVSTKVKYFNFLAGIKFNF